jgi:hypothetical protein
MDRKRKKNNLTVEGVDKSVRQMSVHVLQCLPNFLLDT